MHKLFRAYQPLLGWWHPRAVDDVRNLGIEIVLRGLKRRAIGQRVTRDALAGVQESLNQPNDAQIPFMITQTQREALRAKGFDDDQIANMTPEKAHQLLRIPPPPY